MNQTDHQGVQFYSGEQIPLEMHKARMVQRIHLRPVQKRFEEPITVCRKHWKNFLELKGSGL